MTFGCARWSGRDPEGGITITHIVTIVDCWTSAPRGGFEARCTCGYNGARFTLWIDAAADRDAHLTRIRARA